MINFKEINSLDDLIDIVKDKKNLIYGVRFAVDPLNIENYSNLLNKFKNNFLKLIYLPILCTQITGLKTIKE